MHAAAITLAISGIQMAAKHLHQRGEHRHVHLISQLESSVQARRVDVIEKACHDILSMYAEQARDYMAEKKDYTGKILEATDALLRINLMSRSQEIDTNLENIRTEARMLYAQMGKLLTALDIKSRDLAGDLAGPLALPEKI